MELEALETEVDACRRTAAADPDGLAAALCVFADALVRDGRIVDALAPAEEAVAIYLRLLEAGRGDLDLARSRAMDTLVYVVQRVERPATDLRQVVLSAVERVADSKRRTATGELSGLAEARTEHARILMAIGLVEQAVSAGLEAVAVWRQLATAEGRRVDPELARSLSQLGADLQVAGRLEEALTMAQEAVAVGRRSLADQGDVDQSVSSSLRTLVDVADRLDRRDVAVSALNDVADSRRELARAAPESREDWLARRLSEHAALLWDVGERELAVTAAEETVAVWRRLAAADPGRFEPELELAMRDLRWRLQVVGRHEDVRAVDRELYAPLRSEMPVEEADFSVRTYNMLKRLGCDTLGDVARIGWRDILYQASGRRWVVQEINEKLEFAGLAPLGETPPAGRMAAVPDAPDWSFGALCVLCEGEDAVAQIYQAIVAAYAADGAHPADQEPDEDDGPAEDLEVNSATELGDDLVLIEPAAGAWTAVRSERWELAPQSRHPLALRLSSQWSVLSVTASEGAAYELCLYRHGAPVQYAAHGTPTGPVPTLAPLDFGLLAEHAGIPVGERELRAALGHPVVFANLTGLPMSGLHAILGVVSRDELPGRALRLTCDPRSRS